MGFISERLVAISSVIFALTVYSNLASGDVVIERSSAANDSNTLVIIDTSVAHISDLLPGIDSAATVVLLDTNRDQVVQLTEILSRHKDISSLHIFTHGAPGRLYLGETELSSKTLNTHKKTLNRWSRSLAADADVFLYGCDIAQGEGVKFIRAFAELIGADIAASNNLTASTANSGDWNLEVSTGLINHKQVLALSVAETSDVVLALPADVTNELVIQDLNQPVSMKLLPSGEMLILERAGTILIMDPTQPLPSASLYLQLPNVDSNGEKGLLDIALDADFVNNNYFYVYYHNATVDRARISRFIHDVDHAHPEDEAIAWEDPLTTGLQNISDHWGGGLDVGPNGYLYLTLGDKKDFPDEAQDLSLSAGKIIRVNPSAINTGGGWLQGGDNSHLIPAGNPFIDGPGGNLDEIWAFGLRNPFRAKWDIPTGRLFIGEVGGNVDSGPDVSYEDLHMVTLADEGTNFGWPMCEGLTCSGSEPFNYSAPIFTKAHTDTGAIMAGMVYRGNLYPSKYAEAFFFTDYVRGWLRYITFDENGNVSADVPDGGHGFSGTFEMDHPVALEVGPEGAIYYSSITEGHIGRFMYNNGNQPPTINQATADVTSAPVAPVNVNFVGVATDLEDDPIDYLWDFGDGMQSASSTVTHSYTAKGAYTARLSASDPARSTVSDPLFIEIGQPPVLFFTEPADGLIFRAGDVISIKGSATDADGILVNDNYTWTVEFKHNSHFHPIVTAVLGASCEPVGSSCYSFTVPSSSHAFSDDTGFKITMNVTDSDGLVRSENVLIVPDKVDVSFSSNVPGGVVVTLDQLSRTEPFVYDTLIGFMHSLEVPETVYAGGNQYIFDSWSNGVTDASQAIVVPDVDVSFVATYINTGPLPRTSDGLQVLYAFEAGSGDTIYDVSGVGSPLNLNISNVADVTWGVDSLSVDQSTLITSLVAASKLNTSIAVTHEITVEAWLTPANTTQKGPARIVSISGDSSNRNFTLGQGSLVSLPGDHYSLRLRTTTTGNNGSDQSLSSPAGTLMTSLQHVVYTRDASGNAHLYIDNARVSAAIGGDLSNWNTSYQFVLANEISGGRPWLGTLDLVAIYNRALTVDEVGYNFYEGPDSTTGRVPPLVITTTDFSNALLDANYSQTASSSGGVVPYSWTLDSGTLPDGLLLDSATGTVSGVSTTLGNYVFTLKATDAAGAFTTQLFSMSVLLDTDTDGLADVDEVNIHGTDPALYDSDSDGLSDGDEVNVYLSNPLIDDSDGDGLSDGDEVNVYATNPLFFNSLGDIAPRGAPDGAHNAADVLLMSQLVLAHITPTAGELLLADLNQDNEISIGDLLLSIRIALGLMLAP